MVRIVTPDMEGLLAASEAVAEGGVIGYPTDTVYGLGCNPFNHHAINRVIRAKGDRSKPLPVLAKSVRDAELIVDFTINARRLAAMFWPGPLTMVLRAKTRDCSILAPRGTIGVRSPGHTLCLNLLGMCSGLLVGTSANKTGHAPATTAREVIQAFDDEIDLVVDGGKSILGVASTVVDLSNDFLLLREGPISREELLRCLRESG
jgi:L-threonylcarbamoyladenylate synthase